MVKPSMPGRAIRTVDVTKKHTACQQFPLVPPGKIRGRIKVIDAALNGLEGLPFERSGPIPQITAESCRLYS